MSLPGIHCCENQAPDFWLQTNSEEQLPGIASKNKMKMPNSHYCEHPAISFRFLTNSEKCFLGFAGLKDNIDARYSLL